MRENTRQVNRSQWSVTDNWKKWTKLQVESLPYDVQRCQSFRSGLKNKAPTKSSFRKSCRRDVCPACGKMWSKEFITQNAIRFRIPNSRPYSLVINFSPLSFNQFSKKNSPSVKAFIAQRKHIDCLKSELDQRFGESKGVAGWFGIAHFVRIPGGKVRHHLHLVCIGAYSGLREFFPWVKRWSKKRHLNAVMDLEVRGERSLPRYADYFRHEPIETGVGENKFSPQQLSQIYETIEKTWRAQGGKRSMFNRFIGGPVWSYKGLRGLQSRVVKERISNALSTTTGVRERFKLLRIYEADLKRQIFASTSVPNVRWSEKCPLYYAKSKKKAKKCKGISFASGLMSAMICRCEKCKKTWAPMPVYGRKRKKKAK